MKKALKVLLLLPIVFSTAFVWAEQSLLEHYRHLHRNPELSGQERATAAYMAEQLQSMGYTVKQGVGGYGLVATLGNRKGPTVLYRADMDGLPVQEKTGLPYSSEVTATNPAGETVPVMHACGHDVHMTVLLGVARRMAAERERWAGTLVLLAQPAEEIGAGARAMLADGLIGQLAQPDYNLAFHVSPDLPAGTVGYVEGYAMANVDSVDITVYGVGGHGAYPQKTKDPVVMAARIVMALQTIVSRELSPLESAVVTVGSIHGGTKHNIIPDEVHMQLTVRTYSDETRDFVLRRIREISEGVAASAGVPADRLPEVATRDEYTPAVYNNPGLVETLLPVLDKTLGKDNVLAVDPVMAGEDFARYGRTSPRIPSALWWLGSVEPARLSRAVETGETLPGLHSAYFAPDAAPTLETGVKSMSAMLQALMPR